MYHLVVTIRHCANVQGMKRPSKPAELSQAEREFRTKSWWWLGGAAAVLVGYILLSGRYIEVSPAYSRADGCCVQVLLVLFYNLSCTC